jgi:hypothetical protein
VADVELDALEDADEFPPELPHAATTTAIHIAMAAETKNRLKVPPLPPDVDRLNLPPQALTKKGAST